MLRVVFRNFLGVIIGLVVGMTLNKVLIEVNSVFYPLPEGMKTAEGLSRADFEPFNAHIATLPVLAFVLPLLAHLSQAFVGGWIAARIGSSRPVLLAMIVGVITLTGAALVFFLLPDSPKWMMIELPLCLVVAWKAGKMVECCRAPKESF
jgi:hypothetical protein